MPTKRHGYDDLGDPPGIPAPPTAPSGNPREMEELRQAREALHAICDLASARLSSMESGGFAVDENLRHDLKEIVRLTGKTWR